MRDYAIVTPAFWIGETGKLLRGHPEAQLLALYLMTCPHSTMTGVFHCPLIYMAHETGLPIEGAMKGLARLSEVGFCEYDEASECVFVIKMASFQIADSLKPEDNRHKGLLKELLKMAPHSLKARFIATYSIAFSLPKTGLNTSPSEAPPKPRTGTRTRTGTKEADKSASRPAKKCPVDFVVPENLLAEITAECPLVDIAAQTKIFRDYTFKTAKTDWPATWRNWMRLKQERLVEAVGSSPESFKQQDARKGRERWEEMTGEQHPENAPAQPSKVLNVIDFIELPRIGASA